MNFAGLTNPALPIPGEVTRWGYRLMSESDYRQFPAVNASLIKCPTLAEAYAMLTAPQKQSEALALGTLADMAILTPNEPWGERFAVADIPTNPATGKAYGPDTAKAMHAVEVVRAANPGKFVASLDEIKAMRDQVGEIERAVHASALCRAMLDGALKQVSGVLWHPTWKCWVKWKPDILPLRPCPVDGWGIADLKTTRRHILEFERECREFGYWDQAGWYAHCHELLMASQGLPIKVSHFDFLVVSKADTGARHPRPAMARKIRVPLNPELNVHMEGFTRRIFPGDGFGRVESFLAAAAEHARTNPDPTDAAALRRIWGAYEHESAPYVMAKLPFAAR